MKNLSTALAMALLFIGTVRAGDNFNWPAYTKQNIPDSLKNEDAVFLQNVYTLDFNTSGETDFIVFRRILVNSEKAIEDLAHQTFYVPDQGKIVRLFGRIIKSNGTIVELENIDQLKSRIVEKDKYKTTTLMKYQILYPNVEQGDVLDLYYDVKLNYYVLSNIFYLEDEWPSLYSRVTIRNYSRLDLTTVAVNDHIQPKASTSGGITSVNWEKRGVGKMVRGYFNAPRADQPCMIYNLWSPQEILDYDAVFAYDVNKFPENYSSFTGLSETMVEEGVFEDAQMVTMKLQNLIKHFEQNFTWQNDLQLDPHSKATGHFKGRLINEDAFFFYVQKFLSEQGRVFYRCYSKELLDGPFVHGIVAIEQLDKRYILYIDEFDREHFVFPPTRSKYYYVDEIPFYVEGNQSIGMKGGIKKTDELIRVGLPQSTGGENTHFMRCMVNLSEDGVSVRRDDDFSGQFSNLIRGKSEAAWLEELNITDTLLAASEENALYPYSKKYKQTLSEGFELNKLSDSLFWFSLDNMLPHSFFDEGEESEEMGDYIVFPFLKTENFSFYVMSEGNLKLAESFNEKRANGIGSVTVSCIQATDNTLKLTYEMKLDKRILASVSEVEEFIDLVSFWKQVRSKKWIVTK